MTPVWWLLVFIPALVALYFLKLKRREVEVSSTMLWKRSLEDLHVNSPFQRLRKSLLFFLQLLGILFLITSVWQPRCAGVRPSGRSILLLMDLSASMQAREREGTRFELARREALALAASLRPGDRMALLSFSTRTTSVQPFTADRALLEQKIRSLEPTAQPGDAGQALAVAQSLAASIAGVEVVVLGDGCYRGLAQLPDEIKRLNVRFIGSATPLANIAITEADVRRSFGRRPRTEVFARVENFSSDAVETTLALHGEERLIDGRRLELGAGDAQSVVFDVSHLPAGLVRVELETEDALAEDNRVFLEVAPPGELSVLQVGEANPWLELALRTVPNIKHRRVSLSEYRSGGEPEEGEREVVIFDRRAPPEPPERPSIYIGCLPPLPEGVAAPERLENPVIIDWDRNHPVNRFLAYTDIIIEAGFAFADSPHVHSLADVESGGLLGVMTYRREGRFPVQALVVGFDILKSNWPLGHYSYPIFFANALGWLGGGESGRKSRWRSGEPLVEPLRQGDVRAAGSFVVRTPGGRLLPATVEPGGAVVFTTTEWTGVYELLAGGEVVRRFPVSLLDGEESRLAPEAQIDFGDFAVATEARLEEGTRDLWRWFALAAVAMLLIEWWIYNRRLYS
jgi:hypothetical protein